MLLKPLKVNRQHNHEPDFERLTHHIERLFGFSVTANQADSFYQRIADAAAACNRSADPDALIGWIQNIDDNSSDFEILAKHITIGETYFFREKGALHLLVKKIIPELRSKKSGTAKQLNIWSAGCSSGEEPYTLAILLKENLSDFTEWKIRLLATDISQAAINKARSGIYTKWSFRETEPNILEKYFRRDGRFFRIDESIKDMVTFELLNLHKHQAPPPFFRGQAIHVIFCRNVLMYLKPEIIKDTAQSFHNFLIPGGWFITSQVELNDQLFSMFEKEVFENGVYYRKSDPETKPAPSKLSKAFSHQTNGGHPDFNILKKDNIFTPAKTSERSHKIAIENEAVAKKQDNKSKDDKVKLGGALQRPEQKQLASTENHLMAHFKNALQAGEFEKAGNLAAQIDALVVNDSVFYLLYGLLSNELHEHEQAEKLFRQALFLQPDCIAARWNLLQLLKKPQSRTQFEHHHAILTKQLQQMPVDSLIDQLDGINAGQLLFYLQQWNI